MYGYQAGYFISTDLDANDRIGVFIYEEYEYEGSLEQRIKRCGME